MFDYIFTFPDEATAHAALDPLGYAPEGEWMGSHVLPVRVGVGYEEGPVDPLSGEASRREIYAGGYWLVVSKPEVDEELWNIPFCMREADRAKAEAGEPYVTRERFTPEQLAQDWRITPQWAGVRYENKGSAA